MNQKNLTYSIQEDNEDINYLQLELIEDVRYFEEMGNITVYGIQAHDKTGKKILIRDISSNKKNVTKLIDLCNKNKVTFITLSDIIEDYI